MRFRPLALPAVALALPCFAGAPPPSAEITASARILIQEERLPEARESLERLVAREPADLEAALLLAKVYDGLKRRDDAIALLEPWLDKKPADHRVLGAYAGQCMLRAGELDAGFRALRLARRGREIMERAVALAPQRLAYREALADFYRQAPALAGGSLERAREHAEAIRGLDPERGAARLAPILVEQGKPAEAMAVCEAALAARPDGYLALFALGRTAAETGLRLAEGEAALRRCLALTPARTGPEHAEVWFRLGLLAEKRGELDAAMTAYRSALGLAPNFKRPAEALARLEKPR